MTHHSEPIPFDLTVFEQGQYWTDPNGHRHTIEDLTAADKADLAAWLLRNAEHFYLRTLTRELATPWNGTPARVPALMFAGAEEWMRNTELMRALTGMARRPVTCSSRARDVPKASPYRSGLARLLRR